MPSVRESVPGAGGPAPPPRRTAVGALALGPRPAPPVPDPAHTSSPPSPEAGGHLHALWPHHGILKASVPLWGVK